MELFNCMNFSFLPWHRFLRVFDEADFCLYVYFLACPSNSKFFAALLLANVWTR